MSNYMANQGKQRPPGCRHSSIYEVWNFIICRSRIKSGQFICYNTGQIYLLLTSKKKILNKREKGSTIFICSDVLKFFSDNLRNLENGHDHRRNAQGRVH